MKKYDMRRIPGWIAVLISSSIICFWAYWGILENFHEGWYHETLLVNIGMMFLQYLSPMLIFMSVTLISITWPRFGSILHLILALLAAWFFHIFTNPTAVIIVVPLVAFAALYRFGILPQSRKLVLALIIGLPLLTLVVAGIEPALRVSQRFDDRNLDTRVVEGNGVSLVWVSDGAGWPRIGMSWYEARQTCLYLNEDGLTLNSIPQEVWRLPTVDEVVRSMTRHGQNVNGIWNADQAEATYSIRPDKESPLWNVRSPVIYWWTATEIDEEQAYIIVYDGRVWDRTKNLKIGSLGFRCVR